MKNTPQTKKTTNGLILSNTSVNVHNVREAFQIAQELNFDGIETAILHEKNSRSTEVLKNYEQQYQIPIVGIHSPTMLLAYNIYGFNLKKKIAETINIANTLNHTKYIVIHPPYKLTKAAKTFHQDIKDLKKENPHLQLCVENMFPYGFRNYRKEVYAPTWLQSTTHIEDLLFDTSHAGLSGQNILRTAETWAHKIKVIHLSDAHTQTFTKGSPIKDEHLPLGEGDLPLHELYQTLHANNWEGITTLEINTHKQKTLEEKAETINNSVKLYQAYQTP